MRVFIVYRNIPLNAAPDQIERTAEDVSKDIFELLNTGSPSFDVKIPTDYINMTSEIHAEKWVEEIGLHFDLYSNVASPPSVMNAPLPIRRFKPLKTKTFSGDVSGTIGEALTAALLRYHYLISETEIIHLRGTKTSGLSPDFYLLGLSEVLKEDVCPSDSSKVCPPIAVEAKGITTPEQNTIEERAIRGLAQINSLMSFLRLPFSIVTLALRNSDLGSYDIAQIVVNS